MANTKKRTETKEKAKKMRKTSQKCKSLIFFFFFSFEEQFSIPYLTKHWGWHICHMQHFRQICFSLLYSVNEIQLQNEDQMRIFLTSFYFPSKKKKRKHIVILFQEPVTNVARNSLVITICNIDTIKSTRNFMKIKLSISVDFQWFEYGGASCVYTFWFPLYFKWFSK